MLSWSPLMTFSRCDDAIISARRSGPTVTATISLCECTDKYGFGIDTDIALIRFRITGDVSCLFSLARDSSWPGSGAVVVVLLYLSMTRCIFTNTLCTSLRNWLSKWSPVTDSLYLSWMLCNWVKMSSVSSWKSMASDECGSSSSVRWSFEWFDVVSCSDVSRIPFLNFLTTFSPFLWTFRTNDAHFRNALTQRFCWLAPAIGSTRTAPKSMSLSLPSSAIWWEKPKNGSSSSPWCCSAWTTASFDPVGVCCFRIRIPSGGISKSWRW